MRVGIGFRSGQALQRALDGYDAPQHAYLVTGGFVVGVVGGEAGFYPVGDDFTMTDQADGLHGYGFRVAELFAAGGIDDLPGVEGFRFFSGGKALFQCGLGLRFPGVGRAVGVAVFGTDALDVKAGLPGDSGGDLGGLASGLHAAQ